MRGEGFSLKNLLEEWKRFLLGKEIVTELSMSFKECLLLGKNFLNNSSSS